MIDYAGYSTNKDLMEVQKNLKDVTVVKPAVHRLSEIFTLLFREQFMINLPMDILKEGGLVTRSNWTYHTALSIQATARLLALNCRFETMGRLDATIETLGRKPQVVLLAEWEWDHEDIFGKGKEIEKLWTGVEKLDNADAFLLTYCPITEYFTFVKRILDYWQQKLRGKNYPSLYLVVIAYQRQGSILEFHYIRTIQALAKELVLWDDVPFS